MNAKPEIDQSKLSPCGYCRRCSLHDDPGGCLEVEAYERELVAAGLTAREILSAGWGGEDKIEEWAIRSFQAAHGISDEWGVKAPAVVSAPTGREVEDGTCPCDGCKGDGIYYGAGIVLNGVFQGFTGTCFRCSGKGRQTPADVKRNTYYDNRIRRVYA